MYDGPQQIIVSHSMAPWPAPFAPAAPTVDSSPPPDDDTVADVEHAAWAYELDGLLLAQEAVMQPHHEWLHRHERLALRRHVVARSKHLRPQPSRRRHIARMRELALDGAGIEWRCISEPCARDKYTPRQLAGCK